MSDEFRISSIEELREIIPDAAPEMHGKVVPRLGAIERRFIAQSPLLLLGTADARGAVTVSPRGDAPGFVTVEDDTTLLMPERPGNRLAFGLTNILENPKIGILFLLPGSGETFRVDGTAELTRDPRILEAMSARGKRALLATRIQVERCFFQCSRAFVRSKLWDHESWPEPMRFSWGNWAQQWFGIPDDSARKLDAEIEHEAAEQL